MSSLSDRPVIGPQAALREWLAVGAVALGTFALVTSEFIPVGLITRMSADFGSPEGATGLMMTVPAFAAAIAAPAVMLGAKRMDRRIMLCLLSALLMLSNLVVALAPSLGVALFGRVLLGIDVGAFWAISSIVAAKIVPAASVARASAIIFAGISLGSVVGVPAGALIGSAFGWRAAFESVAAFGALVLVAQLVLLPRLPPSEVVTVRHLASIFRIPSARLGLLACFLAFAGQFAAYTYMGAFLEHVTKMQPALLSSLLLGYGVAGFVGNFVGGALSHRGPRVTYAGAAAALGLSILLLTLGGQSQMIASIAVLAWGFAFGALPIATQGFMARAAAKELESASAVFVSILQMGFAVGAFVGGRAVDTVGLPTTLIGAAVASIATGFLIMQFGRIEDANTDGDAQLDPVA
ncbi:MFS transporter [Luteibacter aegosomatissinici]|uniref:MFS transporter n=1 Tax=Luteibacter aegosomatissinici TaxID=2911539 RepID=UPI001FF86DE2|nr:MFS transporter [Luteibacter aegosomatissinici]UPG96547.1 MFS transporter [Luteibacter aegosomatissinici]